MLVSHMKIILSLVVLFVALVQCLPSSTQNTADKKPSDNNISREEPTWITITTDDDNPNGAKAGESGAKPPKGQYTLKFVPLIRIIASFLPRILSRFTQRIQGGRSLHSGLDAHSLEQARVQAITQIFTGLECNTQHLGRWADPSSTGQFFECAVNVDSLPECNDVPPNVSRQIIREMNMKHRSLRSINPSSPTGQNRLIKSKSSSSPVLVYKVSPCVSLVLHVCSPEHVYSSRLQHCIPTVPISL
uniref:Uncharacterized protein n=1 Tax=Cacopsylla melanoneura TaxID=428564 RepID=A0A8D9F7L8_9HEMI